THHRFPYFHLDPPILHSLPTRRSSDLAPDAWSTTARAGCELATVEAYLHTPEAQLHTPESPPHAPDVRLHASDTRLHAPDARLQAPDADCKLLKHTFREQPFSCCSSF